MSRKETEREKEKKDVPNESNLEFTTADFFFFLFFSFFFAVVSRLVRLLHFAELSSSISSWHKTDSSLLILSPLSPVLSLPKCKHKKNKKKNKKNQIKGKVWIGDWIRSRLLHPPSQVPTEEERTTQWQQQQRHNQGFIYVLMYFQWLILPYIRLLRLHFV